MSVKISFSCKVYNLFWNTCHQEKTQFSYFLLRSMILFLSCLNEILPYNNVSFVTKLFAILVFKKKVI